jgi:branched-chain amino acid transport system ATP-binding protein
MVDGLLVLHDVHTHVGAYHVLHGVDFAVAAGGVTALLGRNGAGKTTTLRTIMGLWQASRGTIAFDGRDISRLKTAERARLGITYVPEQGGVFSGLTVAENVALSVRRGPIDPDRLEWIVTVFPPLKTFWSLHAGRLSGGQKQMLAVATALAAPARMLLIDEPSKGLSPVVISAMIAAFADIVAGGTAILLVEQNFAVAEAIGIHLVVMNDGRVAYQGTVADIVADRFLQQRLLGLSLEAT